MVEAASQCTEMMSAPAFAKSYVGATSVLFFFVFGFDFYLLMFKTQMCIVTYFAMYLLIYAFLCMHLFIYLSIVY